MIVAFHTLMLLLNEYFTPSWQKEVRNISREIILAMQEAKESSVWNFNQITLLITTSLDHEVTQCLRFTFQSKAKLQSALNFVKIFFLGRCRIFLVAKLFSGRSAILLCSGMSKKVSYVISIFTFSPFLWCNAYFLF